MTKKVETVPMIHIPPGMRFVKELKLDSAVIKRGVLILAGVLPPDGRRIIIKAMNQQATRQS